jgi:hypothetical protein
MVDPVSSSVKITGFEYMGGYTIGQIMQSKKGLIEWEVQDYLILNNPVAEFVSYFVCNAN